MCVSHGHFCKGRLAVGAPHCLERRRAAIVKTAIRASPIANSVAQENSDLEGWPSLTIKQLPFAGISHGYRSSSHHDVGRGSRKQGSIRTPIGAAAWARLVDLRPFGESARRPRPARYWPDTVLASGGAFGGLGNASRPTKIVAVESDTSDYRDEITPKRHTTIC
jgi:hypothetical protein